MKFVHNFYLLIIILRSAKVETRSAADFTIEELKHISKKLKPIECMRLLEAIYSAVPINQESRTFRETPVNKWISEHACLDELKTWNRNFPADETEPKARLVMILQLNALGRLDLANYVRKNRSEWINVTEKNVERIFKREVKKKLTNFRPRDKRRKISRRSVTAGTKGKKSSINGGKIVLNKRESEIWKHGMIKKLLVSIVALGFVTVFGLVILILVLGKKLNNPTCLMGKRSDSCLGTKEKGLQCTGCLDRKKEAEMQSNKASQMSEIDIEVGSCENSVAIDCRRSFSDTILCQERLTPGLSFESLKIFNEQAKKSGSEIIEENWQNSSCRCRPLDEKICQVKPKKMRKRKKKKNKVKAKEETCNSAKSYFKTMQEKIFPRLDRGFRKNCDTLDTKQLQDKILKILNQDCGVCQCCNCTAQWEISGTKVKKSPEKRERKSKEMKRNNSEKLLTYQVSSVTSNSPMLEKRSNKDRSVEKPGDTSLMKKLKNKVQFSTSSSETETCCSTSRGEKHKKIRSKKRSRKLDASVKSLITAQDKPKRFF